tara:strand:- start:640 stop:849 length:210 start_codon:yes stop_codon:yes gene_type:complete
MHGMKYIMERKKRMSRSKDLNHLVHLKDEINELKTRIRPEDTGHIHTTIGVLEGRVEELTKSLSEELDK